MVNITRTSPPPLPSPHPRAPAAAAAPSAPPGPSPMAALPRGAAALPPPVQVQVNTYNPHHPEKNCNSSMYQISVSLAKVFWSFSVFLVFYFYLFFFNFFLVVCFLMVTNGLFLKRCFVGCVVGSLFLFICFCLLLLSFRQSKSAELSGFVLLSLSSSLFCLFAFFLCCFFPSLTCSGFAFTHHRVSTYIHIYIYIHFR